MAVAVMASPISGSSKTRSAMPGAALRVAWAAGPDGQRPSKTRSVMPGERRPVRLAFLQKGVPALYCLFGHIGEPRGFAGEHLLSDEPVVNQSSWRTSPSAVR